MKMHPILSPLLACLLAAFGHSDARGEQAYRLTEASTYAYGCLAPCMCPLSAPEPMSGSFKLAPASEKEGSGYYIYRIRDIRWSVMSGGGSLHEIRGEGTYRVSKGSPRSHRMELQVAVDGTERTFDSGLVPGGEEFPSISVSISQGSTCFDIWMTIHAEQASESERKDAVAFIGRLDSVSCTAVCGTCCGALGALTEKNNGFPRIHVGAAAVTLEPYRDTGSWHRFSGYFYDGLGSCDTGRCTFFFVDSVDQPVPADSSLDTSTWLLRIPSLVLDGGERYGVEWNLLSNEIKVESLQVPTVVPQSGDCSDPATRCAERFSCVPYYGIAGGAGPLFQTCEIPCSSDKECPEGQTCAVIADGPGQVCVLREVP